MNQARTEIERLTAEVERVLELHQPVGRHNFCGTCAYAPWPCATYRALSTPDLPKLLAAAWDEGHHSGHEDARAVQPTYPNPTPNPYRQTEGA